MLRNVFVFSIIFILSGCCKPSCPDNGETVITIEYNPANITASDSVYIILFNDNNFTNRTDSTLLYNLQSLEHNNLLTSKIGMNAGSSIEIRSYKIPVLKKINNITFETRMIQDCKKCSSKKKDEVPAEFFKQLDLDGVTTTDTKVSL